MIDEVELLGHIGHFEARVAVVVVVMVQISGPWASVNGQVLL